MKELSPYWFLETPVDREHKFYVLMDYLQSIERDFLLGDYIEPMSSLLRVKRDLLSYSDKNSLSIRTYSRLSEEEISVLQDLSEKFNESDEMEEILEDSIESIEKLVFKFPDIVQNYDDLVKISYNEVIGKTWNKGFLVIRNSLELTIKIYSWNFSLITIGGKENLALLMTEILEPICEYTDNDKEIKKFILENIKYKSNKYDDMIIFSDVSKNMKSETGIEISKEKAVDAIIKNYRNSLSLL